MAAGQKGRGAVEADARHIFHDDRDEVEAVATAPDRDEVGAVWMPGVLAQVGVRRCQLPLAAAVGGKTGERRDRVLTLDRFASDVTASMRDLEKASNGKLVYKHAVTRMPETLKTSLSLGGMLNDYRYAGDPAKAHDSRWVHRPAADPDAYAPIADFLSEQARGVIGRRPSRRERSLAFSAACSSCSDWRRC